MIKEKLCEIMPIVQKASPLVASLINDNKLSIVVGLLALLVNCEPENEDELVDKLKKDQDLYIKLQNLEQTHGKWLANESR